MDGLDIRTLGATHIQIAGQEVKWPAHSARDLLLYLLSFPEGRSRAQIFEDLWQADVDAQSGNRFRVVLHRLRAVLGSVDVVEEHLGRYRLGPDVWRASDVYRFYGALKAAEDTHDPALRRAALLRATDLYADTYLADVDADWAVTAREEHQAAYVQAHLELSLLHCETGACTLSVVSLVRALKADPYVGEHYHQRLMTCLSVVEDKYASIEHYRRFLHFLRQDVNDTAMPDTLRLAERIKAGEHICQKTDGTLRDQSTVHHCPLAPDGHCHLLLDGLLDQDSAHMADLPLA
ncbi:BTAD domain-containing putative transcriptional regulator [Deinococcus sp.]|uniref:AfsR/SARP family transcriptional regulator n=1 Tax=Deinococcus sp. TaxID=47478 RepID=UPI002869966B|nr:BTAD domain-containing putative transcriptional regulator [Deinococcus sp.]